MQSPYYVAILLFFLIWNINAQNNGVITTFSNTCGTDSLMQELLKDPIYKAHYEQRQGIFEEKLKTVKNQVGGCTDPIRLPLAVHFQEIIDPDPDCLRQLTEDQIRILNEDFQGINTDITEWTDEASANFPGVNYGQACMEFYIATANHPEGYGLVEGVPAITVNQFTNTYNKDFAGYINVFVRPWIGTNILGTSPVGGCGDGDGIKIKRSNFGSIPCNDTPLASNYNLGRVLTHEMGHYLNLLHTWGWKVNECEEDDRVDDTPIQSRVMRSDGNGNCPSSTQASCGSLDMHMNHMNSSHDRCKYMFTTGQVARMETWLETNLQNVFNNTAEHCPVCISSDQFFPNSADNAILNSLDAQGSVLISGYLPANKNIRVNAGTYILFEPVFTAEYGSSVLAYIEGCTPEYKIVETGKQNMAPDDKKHIEKHKLSEDTISIKNTPNPFSDKTTFEIKLKTSQKVTLQIFDIRGIPITRLINDKSMKAGKYQFHFDASHLSNGIYIYQLSTPQKSITQKMLFKR